MIKIQCPICGRDLVEGTKCTQIIFYNGAAEFICNNCYFQYFYNTDRRCVFCDKIVSFPYLIKRNNNKKPKIVCKYCEML